MGAKLSVNQNASNHDATAHIHSLADSGCLKQEDITKFLNSGGNMEFCSAKEKKKTLLMKIVTTKQGESQLDLVKFAVEDNRANVDAKNKRGQTPLMLAAYFGSLEIVTYFTKRWQHNVDERDKSGQTALMLAAAQGNDKVVSHLLFWCNANASLKSNKKKTALDLVKESSLEAKQALQLATRKFTGEIFRPGASTGEEVMVGVNSRGITYTFKKPRLSPSKKRSGELRWHHGMKLNVSQDNTQLVIVTPHVSRRAETLRDKIAAFKGEKSSSDHLQIFMTFANAPLMRQNIIKMISRQLPSFAAKNLANDYTATINAPDFPVGTLRKMQTNIKAALDELVEYANDNVRRYEDVRASAQKSGNQMEFTNAISMIKTFKEEKERILDLYIAIAQRPSPKNDIGENEVEKRGRTNSDPRIQTAHESSIPSAPPMFMLHEREKTPTGETAIPKTTTSKFNHRRHSNPESTKPKSSSQVFTFSENDVDKYHDVQSENLMMEFGKRKMEGWQIDVEKIKRESEKVKAKHYRRWGQGDDQAHECRFCPAMYRTEHDLNSHISLEHDCDLKYVCKWPKCGIRFKRKQELVQHLFVHDPRKPHLCPFNSCGTSFSRRNNLSRHMRTHLGIKPFRCSECGKKFSTKSNLDTHLNTHDKSTRLKCDYCGRIFVRENYFDKHREIHRRRGDQKRAPNMNVKEESHSDESSDLNSPLRTSSNNNSKLPSLLHDVDTTDDNAPPIKQFDLDSPEQIMEVKSHSHGNSSSSSNTTDSSTFTISRHQGDVHRHQGDVDRHQGDVDRHQGDVDRHQGDVDRHQGDVEEPREGAPHVEIPFNTPMVHTRGDFDGDTEEVFDFGVQSTRSRNDGASLEISPASSFSTTLPNVAEPTISSLPTNLSTQVAYPQAQIAPDIFSNIPSGGIGAVNNFTSTRDDFDSHFGEIDAQLWSQTTKKETSGDQDMIGTSLFDILDPNNEHFASDSAACHDVRSVAGLDVDGSYDLKTECPTQSNSHVSEITSGQFFGTPNLAFSLKDPHASRQFRGFSNDSTKLDSLPHDSNAISPSTHSQQQQQQQQQQSLVRCRTPYEPDFGLNEEKVKFEAADDFHSGALPPFATGHHGDEGFPNFHSNSTNVTPQSIMPPLEDGEGNTSLTHFDNVHHHNSTADNSAGLPHHQKTTVTQFSTDLMNDTFSVFSTTKTQRMPWTPSPIKFVSGQHQGSSANTFRIIPSERDLTPNNDFIIPSKMISGYAQGLMSYTNTTNPSPLLKLGLEL